jgi:hypothetical protein
MLSQLQLNLFDTPKRHPESQEVLISSSQKASKSLSVQAATKLISYLETSQTISNRSLSRIMSECATSTDAMGGWKWKDAYDAIESALIMYVQANGKKLLSIANPLEAIANLSSLCPTHTIRSSESVAKQQFSTPLTLSYLVSLAARIGARDIPPRLGHW